MEEKYLKVKVVLNAGKNEILDSMTDGTIKVSLKALPKKGKANNELIKFLAKEFKVDKDDIKITSGRTSRLKMIRIKT